MAAYLPPPPPIYVSFSSPSPRLSLPLPPEVHQASAVAEDQGTATPPQQPPSSWPSMMISAFLLVPRYSWGCCLMNRVRASVNLGNGTCSSNPDKMRRDQAARASNGHSSLRLWPPEMISGANGRSCSGVRVVGHDSSRRPSSSLLLAVLSTGVTGTQ